MTDSARQQLTFREKRLIKLLEFWVDYYENGEDPETTREMYLETLEELG